MRTAPESWVEHPSGCWSGVLAFADPAWQVRGQWAGSRKAVSALLTAQWGRPVVHTVGGGALEEVASPVPSRAEHPEHRPGRVTERPLQGRAAPGQGVEREGRPGRKHPAGVWALPSRLWLVRHPQCMLT